MGSEAQKESTLVDKNQLVYKSTRNQIVACLILVFFCIMTLSSAGIYTDKVETNTAGKNINGGNLKKAMTDDINVTEITAYPEKQGRRPVILLYGDLRRRFHKLFGCQKNCKITTDDSCLDRADMVLIPATLVQNRYCISSPLYNAVDLFTNFCGHGKFPNS